MCPCGHDHLLHPDVLADGTTVAGPGRCIEQIEFAPPSLPLFTLAKCDCAGCRCAACSPRRDVVMVEDDGSVRALLDFVSRGQRAQAAADQSIAEANQATSDPGNPVLLAADSFNATQRAKRVK
jgi:hypothetical protein